MKFFIGLMIVIAVLISFAIFAVSIPASMFEPQEVKFCFTKYEKGEFKHYKVTDSLERRELMTAVEAFLIRQNYPFYKKDDGEIYWKKSGFMFDGDYSFMHHLTQAATSAVAARKYKDDKSLSALFTPVYYMNNSGLLRVNEITRKHIVARYDSLFYDGVEKYFLSHDVPFRKEGGQLYVAKLDSLSLYYLWDVSEAVLGELGKGNLPTSSF